VLLVLATAPSAVWAHATLVRSAPADGAVLAEAPREVRLWFDENISPAFSSAQLLDSKSQPIELAGIRTDPSDPTQLILSLRELPAGVYSLLAKTLSEADGHVSRSFLVFGVGEEASRDAAACRAPGAAPVTSPVAMKTGRPSLICPMSGRASGSHGPSSRTPVTPAASRARS